MVDDFAVSAASFKRASAAGGGIAVHIEVAGDVQLSRKILRFGEHAMQAELLWESLYEDFMDIEEEQFTSEGSHGSGGWAPLADSTLKEKMRRGQPTEILRATDDLFNSLARRDAPNQIFENNVTWMVFGTMDPKAKYHQQGTSRMPQRRVLEFTGEERVLILKKIQAFIVTGEVIAL